MVVDCFPFFNELDILRLRLHVMAPFVDRFVIEESAETFSGEPRDLLFQRHRELFAEYEDRIVYIPVTERKEGGTTHERDYFQKNHLAQGLEDLHEDDIVIFGDLDEIPDPETLAGILKEI